MAQTPNPHIVTAYGEELDQLAFDLARMGGLVETQLSDALSAVLRRDVSLIPQIREREVHVNSMQLDVERRVIRLFALRQPMAHDLRTTISALKIAADLERVGDLAKNIGYRARNLTAHAPMPFNVRIERLGTLVLKQLHDVLDALANGDVDQATRVWRNDDEVDEHYDALLSEVLVAMSADSSIVDPGAHFLFVVKNLERIGDHATNIAEAIYYKGTGGILESADTPPASANERS